MKTVQDTFAEMVDQRLKALNTNAFAVENAAGLPPDAVRNVLRSVKKDGPSISRVKEICDALGLDFYFGPPREVGPITQVTLDGADYASIALHEASLSAGPGIANGCSNVIDHLAFRKDWLTRLGVSADQACLARVIGDSMFPTLSPNDMVLIDTRHKEPPIRARGDKDKRRSSIYAFVQDGEARVKRIERPEHDLLILLSDNPDCAPEALTGARATALHIIGKVVWWGHTNRE